jgi:acyl-CoA hydrolase
LKSITVVSLLDVISELFSEGISIAVSDTSEYIYYRPSKRVDLKIRRGDVLKEGTIAHKAISTHVSGTKMMNDIGGSGDFSRNARLAIFVTKSIAKGGNISSIVPFVSHVDHTEHDVDVIVTEQGYADLRGLAPRERVKLIIENCTHPMYREQLRKYYQEALTRGGQTPHVLEKAFSWHTNFEQKGTMKKKVVETI